MNLPGKRVKRTRLVRTDRFVVAVEVEAIIPDADPSEPCFEPKTIELLRQAPNQQDLFSMAESRASTLR